MILASFLLALFMIDQQRVVDCFNTCDAKNLLQVSKEQNETFFVFAITQDCQLVFAREDQLSQFHGLAADIHQHITYCLPNLVQFHWQNRKPNGNLSLKLIFKRANNQICVLPIDFPRESALGGDTIFRYSLLNSLTYAVCSYMPNSSFVMEPELSFMDSIFVDIIYFVDPKSAGSFWTIRQFKIDHIGYLKALETFVVKNFAEELDFTSRTAGEHLLALDTQKLKLYSAHKLHKDVSSTCAYDLLFRPHKARIHRNSPLRNSAKTYRISSYSVDRNTSLFVESQRSSHHTNGFHSRVFVADRRVNYSAKCLLELPYAVKFELVSQKSLEKLREKQLPTFDSKTQQKHHKTSTTHHWPSKHANRPFTKLNFQHSSTTPLTTPRLWTLKTTTPDTPPPQHVHTGEDDEEPLDGGNVDESLLDDENEIQTTEDPTEIEEESAHDEDRLTEEGMGQNLDTTQENESNVDVANQHERLQNGNDTESSFSSRSSHVIFAFMLLLISLSLSGSWQEI